MNIQRIRGQFYSDRGGTVDTGYVATIQRGVASKDKCQFGNEYTITTTLRNQTSVFVMFMLLIPSVF